MPPLTLVQRIPESAPLYVPGPIALTPIATLDAGPIAPGSDGMDVDLYTAAAAAAEEPSVQAAFSGAVEQLEAESLLTIGNQVNQTGMTLATFVSTGNGLLGTVDGLVPPADPSSPPPGAPGPGPGPSPAPPAPPDPVDPPEPPDTYCRDHYFEDPLCGIR
jgi:hypothetical protein